MADDKPNIMVFMQTPGWRPGLFIRTVTKGKHKGKHEVLVGHNEKKMTLRTDQFRFMENFEGELPKGALLYPNKKTRAFLKKKRKKDQS